MLPNPVDYLMHNGHAPSLPSGKAYAYVLAGNGVFKLARARHFTACIQVAACRVAGLPKLEPFVDLDFSPIQNILLRQILVNARSVAREGPREVLYHLVLRDGLVSVWRPSQQAGSARLTYEGGDDADIIADIHSHHQMNVFFSSEDTRDEQGLRFYGVIGRIFDERPQMCLRVGVYGDYGNVAIETLFTGTWPFEDVYNRTIPF
jgi:PRTRC genetic system protein A